MKRERGVVNGGSGSLKRKGYTLLEVLVALAVLILGAALWWNTYGVHVRLQSGHHQKREALSIARNEMERIRYTRAVELDPDTYTVEGRGGKTYRVDRQVADPSGLESPMDELAPETAMPVEVRIVVRLEGEDGGGWGEELKPLADISLLVPEYAWY